MWKIQLQSFYFKICFRLYPFEENVSLLLLKIPLISLTSCTRYKMLSIFDPYNKASFRETTSVFPSSSTLARNIHNVFGNSNNRNIFLNQFCIEHMLHFAQPI